MKARYTVIFDCFGDDDDVKDESTNEMRPPQTDKEGIEQLALEIQEAQNETGIPAGFFQVVSRKMVADVV